VPPVTTNPYWNPKVETLPKEQLRALQLHKLQRLVDRAYNQSPFHRRLYDDAGVTPDKIRTLDDIRRLPFMTREDWMAEPGREAAVRRPDHAPARRRDPLPPDLGNLGPPTAARARFAQGLVVDRRHVVLRLLGLRHPADGHGVLRVLVRLVHRLLGRALLLREDGLPHARFGQHDDRAARQADRRDGRHGRLRDADLRTAHGPDRREDGHRPAGRKARCVASSSAANRPARSPR
jgi:hypothetical protein